MDNLLSAVRLNAVMRTLQDQRNLPARLLWLSRIPVIPALEEELTAYVTARVHAADLIQDDQGAVTYTTGKINFTSHAAVNLKHGFHMTQAMIRLYRRLQQAGTPALAQGEGSFFLNREAQMLDSLRVGILQRIEAMLVAMLMDTFSYNRLGIKITGATWGMPSDLKITVSTAWTDAANATPVSDIQSAIRVGEVRYGKQYRRATMSRAAFEVMIATTEFQNKAKPFLATGIGLTNLDTNVTSDMIALAQRVIGYPGFIIETYDQRYWEQAADGSESSTNYQPLNVVILTDPADDGDATVWDFGQGEVIEPQVAALSDRGNGAGALAGAPVYGPFTYATISDELNPPNLTYWAVDRGWPRKYDRTASAALTVGTITDTIATTDPVFA